MKMMDEGFLPNYYAKQVAEFAADNLDTLVERTKQFGRDTVFGELKAIPHRVHPNGPIGDEVHDAIDDHTNGRPINPLTTITAQRMFAQWLNFREQYKPEIVRTEFTVWSYKHGYAGTGDLMWRKDGELWIIDAKTGTRIQPKVAMQDAAIQHGDVILADDEQGTEEPMPWIENLGVLHIRPRSVRLFRLERTEEAWDAFLACKTLFDWKRWWQDEAVGSMVVQTKTEAP